MNEKVDHLFVKCNFFSTIWSLVSNWLGFVTVLHGDNTEHLKHFCYLCGFSMQTRLRLKIIWLSCVSYQERKKHNFQQAQENIHMLCEKIKFISYSWMKGRYTTFVFYYYYRWFNPLQCMQSISKLFVFFFYSIFRFCIFTL